MKTLVAAFITALLVFTLATAWTEVVQPRLDLLAAASSPKAAEAPTKSTTNRSSRRAAKRDDERETVDSTPVAAEAAPRREMAALSNDIAQPEIAKERLRVQLASVKQQESKLVEREKTLRMLCDEIRWEMAAVEEVRQRSADELAAAERRLLDSAVGKTGIAAIGVDAKNAPTSTAKSKLVAESPSARFALVIQKLADDGGIPVAAALLRGIEERNAAKVLASLSARDSVLASRLSNELQATKEQPLKR